MSNDQWRPQLEVALKKFLGTSDPKKDEAALRCAMALCGAYYTAQRVVSGRFTEDERNGVADMLFSLTSGLGLANPFYASYQPFLVNTLGLVNAGHVMASKYLEEEKRQGGQQNPNTAELRRKAIECFNLIHLIPLHILLLHKGLPAAFEEGLPLRTELEKILVP